MAEYKWKNAHEWLYDKLIKCGDSELLSITDRLIRMVDANQIQDIFQKDMEYDGYFNLTDMVMCPECGENYEKADIIDPEKHVTIDRDQSICIECHRDWLWLDNIECKGCPPRLGVIDSVGEK